MKVVDCDEIALKLVVWPTAIVLSGLLAWFDFVAFLAGKESVQRLVRLGRLVVSLTDIRHRF